MPYLKTSNGLTEGRAVHQLIEDLLDRAIDDSSTKRCDHDAFVVEGLEHLVEPHPRLTNNELIWHEDIVQEYVTRSDRSHPDLWNLASFQTFGRIRHEEQGDAFRRLVFYLLGPRHHEEVVRDMRCRAPGLLSG